MLQDVLIIYNMKNNHGVSKILWKNKKNGKTFCTGIVGRRRGKEGRNNYLNFDIDFFFLNLCIKYKFNGGT